MNENDFYKLMGEKLRKLRKDAKMTQEDLALRVGLHQGDLSAFESRGDKIRSADKINALFSIFGFELLPIEKDSSEKKTRLTLRLQDSMPAPLPA